MKLRVGVIFGGRSGEHEIAIRSARTVIEQIDKSKYEVVPIAISQDGRWMSPGESVALFPDQTRAALESDTSNSGTDPIALVGDTTRRGLTIFKTSGSDLVPLDVIFPVLHGTFGEDGTIQGLLEMGDIPYVGCGVLASSCGMDKAVMKILFRDAGLPICKHIWFLRSQWRTDPAKVIRKVTSEIGLACFVKPANLGSSVGVSRATDKKSLSEAIELAAEYDRKIIVEEELVAREIECAVLGNDEPKASLPGEYVVYDESARFLDYTEKYSNTGNVSFVVPAPLSKGVTTKIQRMAIRAFQSVDGAGLARVDFFLTRNGSELVINELNTMPGLTEVSGYPKMWAASGLPFRELLEVLIELAFERHREKALTKTSR